MASTIIQMQDLSSDRLLGTAARVPFDEKQVPSIAGIPLIAKLGQGGMGAVYVGMHPRLKQEVAVKVLPFPLMAQQPDLVDRFYREAQIAARVKSNHLVGVLDVNHEQNGLFYIIMEFVCGPSAGAYLKQIKKSGCEGLNEAEALDICIAATAGLADAHAESIIHRDVKPDNILIPQTKANDLQFKNAKLADLGLARSEDLGQSLTGSRSALGTPGYMSPEQCMDAKKAHAPADAFSMGATLYALLTGRAPFTGETPMEAVLATLQKPLLPIKSVRPDISTPTAAVIARCLEKEPQRRYRDGAELLEALKNCRGALDEKGAAATISAAAGVAQATRVQPAPFTAPSVTAQKTKQTGYEATMAMTPAKPEAPPATHLSYLASLAAKPGPVPRSASQPVRQQSASIVSPAPRSSAFRNLSVAAIVFGAGVAAWHFWPRPDPPASRLENSEAVAKNPLPAKPSASPALIPVVAETKASSEPEPAPAPAKPAGPDYSRMTTEQRLQALSEALPLAQTAKQSGDWQRVVELLDGPVFSLAGTAYPSKADATALQMQAHVEVMRRADFKEKLREADGLLAAKKFDDARAAYERAKVIWPASPEIARANKGIVMANSGVCESKYDIAMKEGRADMEARSFSAAASNFRKALKEKPSDADAESALKDATTQASAVAHALPNRPPPPPIGDDNPDMRGPPPMAGTPTMMGGGIVSDVQNAVANQTATQGNTSVPQNGPNANMPPPPPNSTASNSPPSNPPPSAQPPPSQPPPSNPPSNPPPKPSGPPPRPSPPPRH